jgi:hypothetical protein
VKLFLPEKTLEEWAMSDAADLSDGKLLVKETGERLVATPAVHFMSLVSGEDQHQLIGRVKPLSTLAELGADVLADSVVLGETAYEVASGYITEVPSAPKQERRRAASPEADLLAAFILDKL